MLAIFEPIIPDYRLALFDDYMLMLLCWQPIENPVRTNQIPRQVPDQSCYTRPLPGVVMGAVLPFGCIFLQLFFILNSIWSAFVVYALSKFLLMPACLILLISFTQNWYFYGIGSTSLSCNRIITHFTVAYITTSILLSQHDSSEIQCNSGVSLPWLLKIVVIEHILITATFVW